MSVRKKRSPDSMDDSDLPVLNSSGSVEGTVIQGDGVEPMMVDGPDDIGEPGEAEEAAPS